MGHAGEQKIVLIGRGRGPITPPPQQAPIKNLACIGHQPKLVGEAGNCNAAALHYCGHRGWE